MAETSPLSEPPGPDVSEAPKLLGITGSLYIVALVLFGGRIYTRIRHRRLGWDDYTITFALSLALLEWSLFLAAVQYGAGRHNFYVPYTSQVTAQHLLYASTLPWAASMMFIKISIACMLLRIKHTRGWQTFLWSMIAVQIASCIASLVFQLLQCMPMAAMWDPVGHPDAHCVKPESAYISLYVNSAISIATDLIFAVVPVSFIRKMHLPLREKIIMSFLMGLGVFAAAASIVKTTLIKNYGRTGDSLWDAIDLTLWSMLEEETGIIAACIPCLKSPFERTLRRFGVLSTIRQGSSYPHNVYQTHGQGKVDSHQTPVRQRDQIPHCLPPIRLSRGPLGFTLENTTPLSSTLGKSTLGHSTASQSQETIWPSGYSIHEQEVERDNEKRFRELVAEGGILLTTEFQVKSEVMSRVESRAGDRDGRLEEAWQVELGGGSGRGSGRESGEVERVEKEGWGVGTSNFMIV